MSGEASVYNLGNIDPTTAKPRTSAPTVARQAAAHRFSPPRQQPTGFLPAGSDIVHSLSLFLPGSGLMLRREFTRGFFFLSSTAFLAAMVWALLGTMDRLAGTFSLFGLPRATGVWCLGVIYCATVMVHVSSLLVGWNDRETCATPHPAVPSLASALVPGWGQLLNGDRLRAALFVVSLWVAAASWLLSSTAVLTGLENLGVYLPAGWQAFSSPAVRWILPAVVWALSVYDAASTAANRRR
jgi:hypothetical protein